MFTNTTACNSRRKPAIGFSSAPIDFSIKTRDEITLHVYQGGEPQFRVLLRTRHRKAVGEKFLSITETVSSACVVMSQPICPKAKVAQNVGWCGEVASNGCTLS